MGGAVWPACEAASVDPSGSNYGMAGSECDVQTRSRPSVGGGIRPGRCDTGWSTKPAVCGYTLLGVAKPGRRRVQAIRATVSGTASAIAAGPDGSIWLVVGAYRRCRPKGCVEPALVRFNPRTRKTTSYLVPASVWPDPRHAWVWANLFVQSDGTVWIISHGDKNRIIWFRNGSFGSRVFTAPSDGGSDEEYIDKNGDLWTCSDHGQSFVTDPSTGQNSKLYVHGGDLAPLSPATMWFVKPVNSCAVQYDD